MFTFKHTKSFGQYLRLQNCFAGKTIYKTNIISVIKFIVHNQKVNDINYFKILTKKIPIVGRFLFNTKLTT